MYSQSESSKKVLEREKYFLVKFYQLFVKLLNTILALNNRNFRRNNMDKILEKYEKNFLSIACTYIKSEKFSIYGIITGSFPNDD